MYGPVIRLKTDSILGKILPQRVTGKNHGKFAAKEFLDELHLETIIENLKTGEMGRVKDILRGNDFLKIQLLDYVGYLDLYEEDNEIRIRSSINLLFAQTEENSLILHKLKLVRHLRKFELHDAFKELEIIYNNEFENQDKFAIFKLFCLKGRMYTRQKKYTEALSMFESAYKLLEVQFTEIEREQLILDRIARLKPVFQYPNWDSIIVDYDLIYLNYFYSLVLFWKGNLSSDKINLLLTEAELLANKHNSLLDQLTITQLRSEILIKLKKYDEAILKLQQGLASLRENKLIRYNIDFYLDLTEHLVISFCKKFDFESANIQLTEIKVVITQCHSKIGYEGYLTSLMIYHRHRNISVESFADLNNYIEFLKINNYNFYDLDPRFIAKNIFYYVIQGIELNTIRHIDDITEITTVLSEISINIPESVVYKALIDINIAFQSEKSKIVKPQKYWEIDEMFQELMKNRDDTSYLSITVKCHYLYFLANQLGARDEVQDRLVTLSEKISETLLSSPYVMIYIKIELIRKILINQILGINHWLKQLYDFYELKEITDIGIMLLDYRNGKIEMKKIIIDLLSNEVSFGKFEIYEEQPISLIITKND